MDKWKIIEFCILSILLLAEEKREVIKLGLPVSPEQLPLPSHNTAALVTFWEMPLPTGRNSRERKTVLSILPILNMWPSPMNRPCTQIRPITWVRKILLHGLAPIIFKERLKPSHVILFIIGHSPVTHAGLLLPRDPSQHASESFGAEACVQWPTVRSLRLQWRRKTEISRLQIVGSTPSDPKVRFEKRNFGR